MADGSSFFIWNNKWRNHDIIAVDNFLGSSDILLFKFVALWLLWGDFANELNKVTL